MAKLWEDYGKGSFRNYSSATEGIAANVLSSCGIDQDPHDDVGGNLQGVDIKRMDAMAAIKASLFERIVDNKLLELIVTKEGTAKIIEVGSNNAPIEDIYYTTQTYTYKNKSSSVMVTGGVPLPERKIGSFIELLSPIFHVKYWSADVIMGSCAMESLKRFVTITYDDPHMSSSYDDGIDNLYNVTDAFESVAGYVYDIENGTEDRYVEITYSNKATVPIKVEGLGTLAITELAAGDYTNESPDCLRGIGAIATCGDGSVVVEIPEELRYSDNLFNPVDKFLGVSGVYVIGNRISVGFRPKEEANSMEAPSTENTGIWIAQPDTTLDIIKLTEGQNYAVAYEGGNVCIQFADRAPLDMQGLFGMGVSVNIPAWADNSTGVYTQTIDILPISETEAINVREIWAAIDVSSPCINIFDPKGDALTIANAMSIKVAPVTIKNEPAPVALNGTSINLRDGVADHDPTTTQDFSNSDMDNALESMNGSVGLSVSMSSFTNEGEVKSFSKNLKELYDADSGVGTVYVCGPKGSEVEIGDSLAGGIVNSIEYRYNDSSSYTISVATGPKFSSNFVASVTGGIYQKKSESVTVEGTIVADYGNGGHYSVLLEGIGRREALNSTMEILRTGDIVTVSIHNNPVEA